jgi:hypothetical protein
MKLRITLLLALVVLGLCFTTVASAASWNNRPGPTGPPLPGR